MPSTDELLAEVRARTDSDRDRERDRTTQEREQPREPRGRSLGARFRERVFSPRAFAIALVVVTAGMLLVGGLLPLGPLGALAGVFAAAFGMGLLGTGRYREVVLAGAAAAGVSTLVEFLLLSFVSGFGVTFAAGAGAGLVAALAGRYFGGDLRAGLTEDL